MDYFGFIYEWIDSTNGKNYIGSHKGSIDDRYVGSGEFFLRTYNKRPTKFSREILEYIFEDNRKILLESEQKYLDLIDWNNTYNISMFASGGNTLLNLSDKQLKERSDKISKANKGQRSMIGKKHSKETRQKMSNAALGRTSSIETKQKLREINLGKTHSEESKKKISESNKGQKRSDETKRKMSKAGMNRRHSDESKRKMSESAKGRIPWNKGIPRSAETKRKISEAKRKWK